MRCAQKSTTNRKSIFTECQYIYYYLVYIRYISEMDHDRVIKLVDCKDKPSCDCGLKLSFNHIFAQSPMSEVQKNVSVLIDCSNVDIITTFFLKLPKVARNCHKNKGLNSNTVRFLNSYNSCRTNCSILSLKQLTHK